VSQRERASPYWGSTIIAALVAVLSGCASGTLPRQASTPSAATPVAPQGEQESGATGEGPRSERLERLFQLGAEEERTHRRVRDVAGLVFGAAAIAGGVALAEQHDNDLIVYALPIIGGTRLLAAAYDMIWGLDPFEELAGMMTELRLEQVTEQEILTRIDLRWGELAQGARTARQRKGVAELAGGTLVAAAGLVLALDPALNSNSSARAYQAGAFTGIGTLILFAGAENLLVREPVEVGYDVFRSGHNPGAVQIGILPGPGLGARVQF
jgi:hypothetical protein